MSVQIKVPAVLRPSIGNREEISVEAATLREAIDAIESQNQGFKSRLLNSAGELNRSAVVFVNEEDVRFLQKLDTPLKSGDEVLIVPMAAGGR